MGCRAHHGDESRGLRCGGWLAAKGRGKLVAGLRLGLGRPGSPQCALDLPHASSPACEMRQMLHNLWAEAILDAEAPGPAVTEARPQTAFD